MAVFLRRRAAALYLLLLTAGCAQKPRLPDAAGSPRNQWSGRLALRVDNDPPQSFAAGFDLRGNAGAGELSLFSPLGSTIARLVWTQGKALLQSDGKTQGFDSLADLTRHVAGAELPIDNLFQWLSGVPASSDGWSADLSKLTGGRLVARRGAPAPAVEMRVVLD